MRIRGAVILAVLSAFAPACGGGGGGVPAPIDLTPLVPVDTSSPDVTIDTSQSDGAITLALKNGLAAGQVIKFTGAPRTIPITEELYLPPNLDATIDGNDVATLSGSSIRRILMKGYKSILTVQRLKFIDARSPDEGAAIMVEDWDGTLTVINCDFTNCKTINTGPDIGGGAIRPTGQKRLQVSGCTFTDCDGSNGGAIDSIGCQVTLINCTFDQCDAFGTGGGAEQLPAGSGQGGIGGAVYIDGVSNNSAKHRLDISNCKFTNNKAKDHGGALFAFTYSGSGSVVFIDQCTFSGNAVTSPPTPKVGLGGAVYHQNNSITVTRSTFDGNTTIKQGGAIWSSCKSGTIENCTFQGNQATGSPGFGGAMTINGSFHISSCTIAQNHAAGWGGGIFAGSPSKVNLRNSLLMDNTGVDLFNGWNVNATLGGGSNNLQWPTTRGVAGPADTPARPSITFADAALSALADNGGPTKTMAITGGPAVDAGSSSAPVKDQRDVDRLGPADIGAFEKNP